MADELPDIPSIAAADNPWGVDVLDVRPVTLHMRSSSKDPTMASNALSYGGEDGRSLADQHPPGDRVVDASLRFRVDQALADGVLFKPEAMEDKWALFLIEGRILFVRSWLRRVWVTADVRVDGDEAVVGPIRGAFLQRDTGEPAELTVRIVDFLLRSHALGRVYPAPLPQGLEEDPKSAAMWCMNMFGRRAMATTEAVIPWRMSPRPLRTDSALHIAIARGELPEVERWLATGLPIDLRAGDGLTTLHWASSRD
ncbi:MAG: ankyrin repeat domain-containing protein, partial [Deltaproteobacteria bacterium]|nr:ankyrin repeat domain-containing protein [Deltaproteobacteria bacterium]